jgi:hypothetical protein
MTFTSEIVRQQIVDQIALIVDQIQIICHQIIVLLLHLLLATASLLLRQIAIVIALKSLPLINIDHKIIFMNLDQLLTRGIAMEAETISQEVEAVILNHHSMNLDHLPLVL